jgi:putative transposase
MIDSDAYLLSVYRYIERNPVRAGIAVSAEDHPWSSVHGNLQRRDDPMLTPHPASQRVGRDRLQQGDGVCAIPAR